ncbi:uncharacterized protein N7479_007566 [Penicillium vulpinum]|uniref:Uncharacterized protein n=1 Tax=Penicillium vulpinum TaxID=29845 RepID=A0A1V6SAJ8_9EURO|nr:uncharacterized protein N7479_007566 [Penicillium vulpinum]KAJ5960416.1 hypothetical protein N7479_007566 [Penicillium vulpinum]OQE11075.1 hypothetical protein PENVUL_c003G07048 [Penicillium vulpinum]
MNSTLQFSPIKDGRRILGEKDSNACLSPATHVKPSFQAIGTPVKRMSMATSPKKLLPSPIFAGQKRTRDQADEMEENLGHVQAQECSPRLGVQSTVNKDMQSELTQTPTPQSSQPERDQIQDLMDTNQSFNVPNTPEQEMCSPVSDSDARKIFIQQKASLLRSRLQSAMRNVTDHQFDRRVSELEEHSRKCPRLSLSVLSTPPLSSRKHFTSFPSSQMKTPRIGCSGFISTPSHSTPDLPGRPSPLSSSVVQQRTKSYTQRTPPRELGSPMQLSSPPATVIRREADRETSMGPRAELSMDGVDSMSPSQRGDAVDGLLKLMSTTGNQSSDSWTG